VVSEESVREVERVLLHVADARARALKAVATLDRLGDQEHATEALRSTADELQRLDRRLRQATYYATPAVAAGSTPDTLL
jgi:hypothetical protein